MIPDEAFDEEDDLFDIVEMLNDFTEHMLELCGNMIALTEELGGDENLVAEVRASILSGHQLVGDVRTKLMPRL